MFALPRRLLNLLNITTWFDQKSFDYFISLTQRMLQQRKLEEGHNNKKRNDFLQLMIESYAYDDALKDTDYNKLTARKLKIFNFRKLILLILNIIADNTEDSVENNSIKTSNTFQITKHKLSEDDIIAQSILFFAGK